MLDREVFAKGVKILAENYGKDPSQEMVSVWYSVLSDLSADEWQQAIRECVCRERFWPNAAVLYGYAKPNEAEPIVRAANVTKAQEIYEDIVDRYERGQHLGPRNVSELWGRAAMDAYAAAGGDAAFAWCEPRNEPFRRKAFIDAFSEVATADPQTMVPMLPPSIEDAFALKPGEAKKLSEVVPSGLGQKFIERARDEKRPDATKAISDDPSPRLVPRVAPVPPKEETTKEMLARLKRLEENAKPIRSTDERLAELKAQADIIRGLPGPGPKVEP
jgi:hypothetical protein